MSQKATLDDEVEKSDKAPRDLREWNQRFQPTWSWIRYGHIRANPSAEKDE